MYMHGIQAPSGVHAVRPPGPLLKPSTSDHQILQEACESSAGFAANVSECHQHTPCCTDQIKAVSIIPCLCRAPSTMCWRFIPDAPRAPALTHWAPSLSPLRCWWDLPCRHLHHPGPCACEFGALPDRFLLTARELLCSRRTLTDHQQRAGGLQEAQTPV